MFELLDLAVITSWHISTMDLSLEPVAQNHKLAVFRVYVAADARRN